MFRFLWKILRNYGRYSNKNAVKNPCLIVEVLLNETTEYDRGEKFKNYEQLSTFVEYMLILRHKTWVEVFF